MHAPRQDYRTFLSIYIYIYIYMSEENAALAFETISSVTKPGGRVADWCAYVPRAPPQHLKNEMK